jgi:hypothetical protein
MQPEPEYLSGDLFLVNYAGIFDYLIQTWLQCFQTPCTCRRSPQRRRGRGEHYK